jgi:hypothetical protein
MATLSEPGPVRTTLEGTFREICWPPSPETVKAERVGVGVG